jgi:signal peptidase I
VKTKITMYVKLALATIFFFSVLVTSCLSINYIDSATQVVGRSMDTSLNDSSLIYGTVIVNTTNNMPHPHASIWIDGTNIKTTSDVYGKFNIKILPGTYTVKCLDPSSEERFLMTLKDISLSPNEKIELLFSHGLKEE